MDKPQITIKDIARALNVSPSTVSRALKDNPDISRETRDLVHASRANIIISPMCLPSTSVRAEATRLV